MLLPTAAVVGGGSLLAGRLAWRARGAPPVSGPHTLIGATATVSAIGDTARIRLQGAWWNVRDPGGDLRNGQSVRVVDRDGLTLIVEPIDIPEDLNA